MASATLTVRRYDSRDSIGGEYFLVSLAGFHYEGEGWLVHPDALASLVGGGGASVIVDQIESEEGAA